MNKRHFNGRSGGQFNFDTYRPIYMEPGKRQWDQKRVGAFETEINKNVAQQANRPNGPFGEKKASSFTQMAKCTAASSISPNFSIKST